MTHPTLQPLMVLLEHAQRQRDDMLARQIQAEKTLAAAQAQQTQLQAYRIEYENRWNETFRKGVTMTLMQCYQDFVGRLHGAVDLQGQQVERLTQEFERLRKETLDAELRVASIKKLVERRESVVSQQAQRRSQKSQDEMASRAAWQRVLERGHFSLSRM
jgi:flagellar protein FliJ